MKTFCGGSEVITLEEKIVQVWFLVLAFLFASLLPSLATSARAEEFSVPSFERVTEPSLIILGKSLKDRKTGSSLSIACVGKEVVAQNANHDLSAVTQPVPTTFAQPCWKIRFVYMRKGQDPYFISKPIVTNALNESEKSFRSDIKRYLKQLDEAASEGDEDIFLRFGSFVASGGAAAWLVATGSSVSVSILPALVVYFLVAPHDGFKVLRKMISTNTRTLQANDGWNWRDDFRTTNHHYFSNVVNQILTHPGNTILNQALSPDPTYNFLYFYEDLQGEHKIAYKAIVRETWVEANGRFLLDLRQWSE